MKGESGLLEPVNGTAATRSAAVRRFKWYINHVKYTLKMNPELQTIQNTINYLDQRKGESSLNKYMEYIIAYNNAEGIVEDIN